MDIVIRLNPDNLEADVQAARTLLDSLAAPPAPAPSNVRSWLTALQQQAYDALVELGGEARTPALVPLLQVQEGTGEFAAHRAYNKAYRLLSRMEAVGAVQQTGRGTWKVVV